MKRIVQITLAVAGLTGGGVLQAAQFASKVVSYEPGEGFATDWATGNGFTKSDSILGAPSRETPGEWGGAVTPFSPPYLMDQILSIGKGGQVSLKFERPIRNESLNPFGLDFLVFGAAGFTITNGKFDGGGTTDGSLFGHAEGETRVSVSMDGSTWFVLDPELAPKLDTYYPTDGSGDFGVPIKPELGADHFAEAGLVKLSELYAGSAGGAGFDLDWAVDAEGEPVALGQAQFVRLEVISGRAEIDGLSDVRPRTTPLDWHYETFATDPLAKGWKIHGDHSLFSWDAETEALRVTWDSEKPNSYFRRPLGQSLTEVDSFAFTFQITLNEVKAGHLDGQPYTFEIALGLLNSETAMSTTFNRGTGTDSPNLVEWDYFPDTGFGATISPAIASDKSQFAAGFTFPAEMEVGKRYTIRMEFDGVKRLLKTDMLEDGEKWKTIAEVVMKDAMSGFSVDAFSISNYGAKGSESSLFAVGWIDEIAMAVQRSEPRWTRPKNVLGHWSTKAFVFGDGWSVERAEDFRQWKALDGALKSDHFFLHLFDADPVKGNRFYRLVR